MRKLLIAAALACCATPALAQSAVPVAMGPGLSTLTDGQATSLRTDLLGRLYVNVANQSVTSTPLTPSGGTFAAPVTTSAVAGSLVVNSAAGNLIALNVVSGASAGFVMVFNATSAPADGAVTPALCYTIAANSTLALVYPQYGPYLNVGTTVVFSTTGCFTKTISATAFISALKG